MPNLMPPMVRFLIASILLTIVATLSGCALGNVRDSSTIPSIPSQTKLDSIIDFYETDSNFVFQDDWNMEFGYLNGGAALYLTSIALTRGYKVEHANGVSVMTKVKKWGQCAYETKIVINDNGGKNLSSRAKITRTIVK